MFSLYSVVVRTLGKLAKNHGQCLRLSVIYLMAFAVLLPSFGTSISLPGTSTTASQENVADGNSCPERHVTRDASCKFSQISGQLLRSEIPFDLRIKTIVFGWVSDQAWETYTVEPGLHPPQTNRLVA